MGERHVLRRVTGAIAVCCSLTVVSCATPPPLTPAERWTVSTYAGTCGAGPGNSDGPRSDATFLLPVGIDVDSTGRAVVAEGDSHTIRSVDPIGNVATLAGAAGSPGVTDGQAATAQFNFPFDVAVDTAGTAYVSDTGNHTIRRISTTGVVSTLAGSPGLAGGADGTGATARFREPAGLAIGSNGHIYVADRGNGTVREVTPSGVVTTLAGSALSFGSTDGSGSSARFSRFNGIDVDSLGNVWIADTNNVTIRKVTPGGAVTTVAGRAGDSAPVDGTGVNARFDYPYQLAIDSADNVFVADGDSTIREIAPTGVVTTPVGVANVPGCSNGVGTDARLNAPQGIAVGPNDRLIVADTGNHVIRQITTR